MNKIKKWYNILADIPEKITDKKIDSESEREKTINLNKIRIKELCNEDKSQEKWIDIPDEVLNKYELIGRPTPLMRAYELEKYLNTPAKIYIKREDLLPTQSFKLNSAIAQCYFAKKEKFKGVISESGAGQWGLALSYASNMFELEDKFFWVKVSKQQKPYRADWCRLFGAEVIDSPSELTSTGRYCLEKDANCPGSLGISIGEAIEYTSKNKGYAYVSGSNHPHVLLHQTVIGLEVKEQLKELNEKPDYFVACCGGGSNLGGLMNPFIFDKEYNSAKFLAAESSAAPRLTKGEYKFDYADPYGITPMTKSYTLGHNYMPPPIHVGGLRQHNGSSIIGWLRHEKILDAVAYSQEEALNSGLLFSKFYGTLPAPESSHALKATIDLALKAKEENKEITIVMCLSGNGLLDMQAYNILR